MLNKISKNYLIFCIYSFIGWIYEVAWFLIMKHKFVNRGVLFGPFLPIYGFGILIILLFLNKFIKKKHLSNNVITSTISIITLTTFIFITIIEFSVPKIYSVSIFLNKYLILLIIVNLLFILLINTIIKKYQLKIDLTPILVFISIWILTTFLEYISHLAIQQLTGDTLWNYSKDFLNIDKRICFDASRNFAIGGTFAIYIIQPLVNKMLNKIKNINIISLIIAIPMIIDLILNVIV